MLPSACQRQLVARSLPTLLRVRRASGPAAVVHRAPRERLLPPRLSPVSASSALSSAHTGKQRGHSPGLDILCLEHGSDPAFRPVLERLGNVTSVILGDAVACPRPLEYTVCVARQQKLVRCHWSSSVDGTPCSLTSHHNSNSAQTRQDENTGHHKGCRDTQRLLCLLVASSCLVCTLFLC